MDVDPQVIMNIMIALTKEEGEEEWNQELRQVGQGYKIMGCGCGKKQNGSRNSRVKQVVRLGARRKTTSVLARRQSRMRNR